MWDTAVLLVSAAAIATHGAARYTRIVCGVSSEVTEIGPAYAKSKPFNGIAQRCSYSFGKQFFSLFKSRSYIGPYAFSSASWILSWSYLSAPCRLLIAWASFCTTQLTPRQEIEALLTHFPCGIESVSVWYLSTFTWCSQWRQHFAVVVVVVVVLVLVVVIQLLAA